MTTYVVRQKSQWQKLVGYTVGMYVCNTKRITKRIQNTMFVRELIVIIDNTGLPLHIENELLIDIEVELRFYLLEAVCCTQYTK